MANFTDLQALQNLTTFRPYVEQIPVDAYVNVGRIKQQQYDQGIQKIQSQIDNVAGIDLIRDVDKQYLQSKLNELQGNLRKVAAGDFSQFQLVNSVGGMVNKVGKDPNIQGAVKSTQIVRKGQQDLEAARKAGKSSPENEWFWNNQVSSWLNNPDVKASFNGRFIEYKDVDSKLRTIAEKLHEVDNSIDVPYQRDAAGNILRDQNGRPLVDDAMLRIKTKGKPAEKILANFYDSLDENDKMQLSITGTYHYRNANKETFKKDIINNYDATKKLLSDSLVNLNLELQTNPKLTTTQRAKIQAKVNDISSRLNNGVLENELSTELSSIDNITDFEGFKARLYTQKYVTNLAKDVSYQSYQQELVSNPYAQMAMERANLQFRYDEARRDQSKWEADLQFRYGEARRDQSNWEADYALKQAELLQKAKKLQGTDKPATPGRLSTELNLPTLSGLSEEILSITGDPATGRIGQIDVLDSQYAPLITDPSIKTPQQRKEYLGKLSEKYSIDPSTITAIKDPAIREYLEKRRALDIMAAQKQVLYNSTVEASKSFDEKLNKELAATGLKSKDGNPLFTGQELVEIAENALKFTQEGSDQAFRLIRRKGTGGWSEDHILQVATDIYRKNFSSKYFTASKLGQIRDEKLKFQSDYLAQRMPERQTSVFTLDVNNSKIEDRIDEQAVEQLLGAKLLEFEQYGSLDQSGSSKFDPEEVSKFKADKEAVYTVEKKYDGTANLIISSEGKQQIVPMTASEFSTFFPGYARINPIDNIKYTILASPNKTTNLSGKKDDAVNAYITGYHLPQLVNTVVAPLVRADVEGSPFNKGDNNDKYVVRMYVNNNGVWESDIITQGGYVNDAELQEILQNIGTKTVDDLLKKNNKEWQFLMMSW